MRHTPEWLRGLRGDGSHGELGRQPPISAAVRHRAAAPDFLSSYRSSGKPRHSALAAVTTACSTTLAWPSAGGTTRRGGWGLETRRLGSPPRRLRPTSDSSLLLQAAPTPAPSPKTGGAYCWGYNHLGQLGDGSLTSRALPTPVSTDLRFVDVTTGVAHTCARTPEGTAYCWGAAGEGQLGTEATLASCEFYGCSLVPVPVSGGHVFNNLTAGTFTCGAAADGSYCWGAYLLGDTASVPVPVRTRGSSGEPFLKMSIGFDHACGIVAGELAYCWGSDYQGKLGDGPVEGGPLPVLVREAPDSLRPL
jgi:hypothetical protein